MNYVKFDNQHSQNDLGLLLKHVEIGALVPNIFQVEITGRNGVLDYTDFFGGITYKNRQITLEFKKFYSSGTKDTRLALDRLCGKEIKVIIGDDPQHYWKGRLTIDEYGDNLKVQEISMTLDAYPFKFKVSDNSEVR